MDPNDAIGVFAVEVLCMPGEVATGGGLDLGDGFTLSREVTVLASSPLTLFGSETTTSGWHGAVLSRATNTNLKWVVYATVARVG